MLLPVVSSNQMLKTHHAAPATRGRSSASKISETQNHTTTINSLKTCQQHQNLHKEGCSWVFRGGGLFQNKYNIPHVPITNR